ncbi:hypothetical protein SBC1_08920 [Caballeronia sp. SBC1]|uniref:hypothetical protein n=1 Tax=Caballeronia sp. SBC1 TaxID=2705548 RepID=UPI00140C81C9|nr:hypothetical protein [Caballeronia sp. SBC1]QIN60913.1 hypothetical protein SBC1_08920 [Caballeronia sp. SBC1]
MSMYRTISERLTKAVAEHRNALSTLNALVPLFKISLLKHLDVEDRLLQVGIHTENSFREQRVFEADQGTNQIAFSVMVQFPIGNYESLLVEIPITFRIDGQGLYVAVKGGDERACGSVHTTSGEWPLVLSDFDNALYQWSQAEVARLAL